MRSYIGRRFEKRTGTVGDLMVLVRSSEEDARPLSPRSDLVNHSPSGFNWGYGGSGPAQLALAILADHLEHHPDDCVRFLDLDDDTGDPRQIPWADRLAVRLHQDIKWAIVARFAPYEDWELSAEQISKTLATLAARERRESSGANRGS